jgi:hypothetical protein
VARERTREAPARRVSQQWTSCLCSNVLMSRGTGLARVHYAQACASRRRCCARLVANKPAQQAGRANTSGASPISQVWKFPRRLSESRCSLESRGLGYACCSCHIGKPIGHDPPPTAACKADWRHTARPEPVARSATKTCFILSTSFVSRPPARKFKEPGGIRALTANIRLLYRRRNRDCSLLLWRIRVATSFAR